jgi:hypothetical protein
MNPMLILMKSLMVQGLYVGSCDMFEAMNRAIGLHARLKTILKVLRPRVTRLSC